MVGAVLYRSGFTSHRALFVSEWATEFAVVLSWNRGVQPSDQLTMRLKYWCQWKWFPIKRVSTILEWKARRARAFSLSLSLSLSLSHTHTHTHARARERTHNYIKPNPCRQHLKTRSSDHLYQTTGVTKCDLVIFLQTVLRLRPSLSLSLTLCLSLFHSLSVSVSLSLSLCFSLSLSLYIYIYICVWGGNFTDFLTKNYFVHKKESNR